MKVVDIKCPGCGAELHISGNRTECFCEYCGSKILLDDGSVKNITVIRDEVKLRELQIEEERIKEAKAKLEEYKVIAEEQKAKRRVRDKKLIIIEIVTLVPFLVAVMFIPKDVIRANDILRYPCVMLGIFQMIMICYLPFHFMITPEHIARVEKQEKLIKELEYNRILNNKQNKN